VIGKDVLKEMAKSLNKHVPFAPTKTQNNVSRV
jgi:hypothetical protein